MARKGKRGKSRGRFAGIRRRVGRIVHRGAGEPKYRILPLAFAAEAVVTPFIAGNDSLQASPIAYMVGALKNESATEVSGAVQGFFENLHNELPTIVEASVAAALTAYAGKKFKLMKATRINKDVSVF